MDKNKLCLSLGNVIRVHHVLVNREADEAGVFLSQHHILKYIKDHPNCSQTELAEVLQQSGAAISLSTKRLKKLGFITKVVSEESLRTNCLAITEKGEEQVEQFSSVVERFNEKMFEGFNEEELEQLSAFIDRINDNLTGGEKVYGFLSTARRRKGQDIYD